MKKSHMQDSENIHDDVASNDSVPYNSITSMGNRIKMSIFLFIMFLYVSSDVFVEKILAGCDSSYTDGRHASQQGVVIQGIVLVIGFVMVSILVDYNCI